MKATNFTALIFLITSPSLYAADWVHCRVSHQNWDPLGADPVIVAEKTGDAGIVGTDTTASGFSLEGKYTLTYKNQESVAFNYKVSVFRQPFEEAYNVITNFDAKSKRLYGHATAMQLSPLPTNNRTFVLAQSVNRDSKLLDAAGPALLVECSASRAP